MAYAWGTGTWGSAWIAGAWGDSVAGDVEAPIGVITSPLNNQNVSGTINIIGLFTDNVGVTDGRLLIDGTPQSYTGQSGGTFSILVDTRTLPDGPRTFSIDAIDAAANHGYSQTITLHVNNAAAAAAGGQRGILSGAAGGVVAAPPRKTVKVIEEAPPKKRVPKKAPSTGDVAVAEATPASAPPAIVPPRRSRLAGIRADA